MIIEHTLEVMSWLYSYHVDVSPYRSVMIDRLWKTPFRFDDDTIRELTRFRFDDDTIRELTIRIPDYKPSQHLSRRFALSWDEAIAYFDVMGYHYGFRVHDVRKISEIMNRHGFEDDEYIVLENETSPLIMREVILVRDPTIMTMLALEYQVEKFEI